MSQLDGRSTYTRSQAPRSHARVSADTLSTNRSVGNGGIGLQPQWPCLLAVFGWPVHSLEFLIDTLLKTPNMDEKILSSWQEIKESPEGCVRKWKVALTPFVAVREADDGVVMHMTHIHSDKHGLPALRILCPFVEETIDRIIDRTLTRTTSGRYSRVRGWPDAEGDLLTLLAHVNFLKPGAGVPRRAPAATRGSSGFDGTI